MRSEPDRGGREARSFVSRYAGLVVILTTLLANAWMPWLEFQYCDWDDIPDVGWLSGFGSPPPGAPLGGAIALRAYSYRPVFWAILWGLLQLGGGHAIPWVFHLFFLCAHAVAGWTLFRLVSARAGPIAGTVAGGLFGILPGAHHAVTWIAAGGDQLAVLFMLLAGLAGDFVLRGRSRLGLLGCVAAAACAACSKETAVALVPALGVLWLIPPRGSNPGYGRRAQVGLAVVVGIVIAWVLRARVFGVWLPSYPGGQSLAPEHVTRLPGALLGFLVPWDQSPEFRELAPLSVAVLRTWLDDAAITTALRVIAGIAFLASVGVAVLTLGKRGVVVVALLLLALTAAIIPVLPLSLPGVHMSRAWYPAAAVLAALVSVACAERGALRIRWGLASCVPMAVLAIDFAIHAARTELHVASAIRVASADLAETVRAHPDTRFVMIQPPDNIGAIAFLGFGFAAATSPPFGNGAPAVPWNSAKIIALCPALVEIEAPLQILEWDGRRMAPRGPALPRIPSELPALAAQPSEPRTFRPVRPVPTRGAAAVRLRLAPGSPATGSVTWTAGREVRRTAFSGRSGGEVVVGLPQFVMDEAWLIAPSLDAVSVEGLELAEPPALRRALPRVAIKSPRENTALALSVLPRMRFKTDAPAAAFRVMLEWDLAGDLRIQVPWTKKASELSRDADGNWVFVIDRPSDAPAEPKLDWPGIAALLGPGVHQKGWVLPLRLVIEALDETHGVVGRSSWVRLGLFAVPQGALSDG